jgi:hypothetical protein
MAMTPTISGWVSAARLKLDAAEHTARRTDLFGMESNQALESAASAVSTICRAVVAAGSAMTEMQVKDLSPQDVSRAAAAIFRRRGIAAPDADDLLELGSDRVRSITAVRPAPSAAVLDAVRIGRDMLAAFDEAFGAK